MDWNIAFGDDRCQFPSGELSRRIQTRLGEGDRLVQFETPFVGPFGNNTRRLTIPAWLSRGADGESQPSIQERRNGYVRFSFGDKSFLYDRLGLQDASSLDEFEEDYADC